MERTTTVAAFVLIEAEVSHVKSVTRAVQALKMRASRILMLDALTGPFDIIIKVEAEDLDELGRFVIECLHSITGVTRTTTCVVIA